MAQVPNCSSRQEATTDMQHDLLKSLCDIDLGWTKVKFATSSFNGKKYIKRSDLTSVAWWCPKYFPTVGRLFRKYRQLG